MSRSNSTKVLYRGQSSSLPPVHSILGQTGSQIEVSLPLVYKKKREPCDSYVVILYLCTYDATVVVNYNIKAHMYLFCKYFEKCMADV